MYFESDYQSVMLTKDERRLYDNIETYIKIEDISNEEKIGDRLYYITSENRYYRYEVNAGVFRVVIDNELLNTTTDALSARIDATNEVLDTKQDKITVGTNLTFENNTLGIATHPEFLRVSVTGVSDPHHATNKDYVDFSITGAMNVLDGKITDSANTLTEQFNTEITTVNNEIQGIKNDYATKDYLQEQILSDNVLDRNYVDSAIQPKADITYVDSQITNNALKAGTGVTINSGTKTISIGQLVSTVATPTFYNVISKKQPTDLEHVATKCYTDNKAYAFENASKTNTLTSPDVSRLYNLIYNDATTLYYATLVNNRIQFKKIETATPIDFILDSSGMGLCLKFNDNGTIKAIQYSNNDFIINTHDPNNQDQYFMTSYQALSDRAGFSIYRPSLPYAIFTATTPIQDGFESGMVTTGTVADYGLRVYVSKFKMTRNMSLDTSKITDPDNLVNKQYVDLINSNVATALSTKQNTLTAGTGVAIASNTVSIGQDVATTSTPTFTNIISSSAPTLTNHCATKAYVDGVIPETVSTDYVRLMDTELIPANDIAYGTRPGIQLLVIPDGFYFIETNIKGQSTPTGKCFEAATATYLNTTNGTNYYMLSMKDVPVPGTSLGLKMIKITRDTTRSDAPAYFIEALDNGAWVRLYHQDPNISTKSTVARFGDSTAWSAGRYWWYFRTDPDDSTKILIASYFNYLSYLMTDDTGTNDKIYFVRTDGTYSGNLTGKKFLQFRFYKADILKTKFVNNNNFTYGFRNDGLIEMSNAFNSSKALISTNMESRIRRPLTFNEREKYYFHRPKIFNYTTNQWMNINYSSSRFYCTGDECVFTLQLLTVAIPTGIAGASNEYTANYFRLQLPVYCAQNTDVFVSCYGNIAGATSLQYAEISSDNGNDSSNEYNTLILHKQLTAAMSQYEVKLADVMGKTMSLNVTIRYKFMGSNPIKLNFDGP